MRYKSFGRVLTYLKGFSLIELTVSLAIILVVASSMLAVFRQGMQASRRSERQTVASNLAKEKFEELTPYPFTHSYFNPLMNNTTGASVTNNFTLQNETYGNITASITSNVTLPEFSNYRRETIGSWDVNGNGTIDNTANYTEYPGNLTRLEVTVYWRYSNQTTNDDGNFTITGQRGPN